MTSNSHHLPPLPDINDVDPLSPADHACIEEIREVLLRRGCLQRFGLMLLHRHFPLSDDEILVESVDVQNRVITQIPRKTALVGTGIETAWRFDMFKETQRCETLCEVACDYDGVAYHCKDHQDRDSTS
jgi:hypothetical protein